MPRSSDAASLGFIGVLVKRIWDKSGWDMVVSDKGERSGINRFVSHAGNDWGNSSAEYSL
jgi:hypothetical protein